jgi:hypothetical protein
MEQEYSMNHLEHNRMAWDQQVKDGSRFTIQARRAGYGLHTEHSTAGFRGATARS